MSTKTLTKFDATSLDLLRGEIDGALADVSKRYGITMKIGRISYSADSFTTKINAAIVGGNVEDEEALYAAELSRSGIYYGVGKKDFGKQLTIYGKSYKFVGLRKGARVNPLIFRNNSTGKYYRFPAVPYVDQIKKVVV